MTGSDSSPMLNHWRAARRHGEWSGRSYTVRDIGPRRDDAVVILSGLAVPWVDWADVLSLLEPTARVLLVERESLGDSCPSVPLRTSDPTAEIPSASSARSVIDEAAAVAGILESFGVARVRVLAHSMGGFIGEAFARLYPDRCERLVLIDASCESPPTSVAWGACPSSAIEERRVTDRLALWCIRFFARHSWARACAARALWWPRRRGLKYLAVEDERAYALSVFADEGFIRMVGVELSLYRRWALELGKLAQRCPLRAQLCVLVASRRRVRQDPWVVKQRARFEALNSEISLSLRMEAELSPVQNSYEIVSASHLCMRDLPDVVASLALRRI